MKKTFIALLMLGLLAGCQVNIVNPGPASGTPVTVDDDNGAQAVIPAGETARFELTVAAQPVRVDVYHDEATADGELEVKALDSTDALYAHTTVRSFFAAASVTIYSLGARAQGVNVSFPYSINLPKNMGKVYVEVTNRTSTAAHVTVKAVTRNEIERNDYAVTSSNGGAILFLGQHDTYKYTGADKNVTFNPTDPANPVHLKAVLKSQEGETELQPGVAIAILDGDTIEVYSDGDGYAGFCSTTADPACNDGIDSGEYAISIN